MKHLFTQIILIYSLFMGFGCSPKPSFYLNKENSFTTYARERHELGPGDKAVFTQLEIEKAANGISSGASPISDSNPSVNPGTNVFFQKRIVPENKESAKLLKSKKNKVFPEQNVAAAKQELKKRFSAAAANDKPKHKLASWGFALGLGGIVLALVGLLTVTTIPLVLAFLMSIPGLLVSWKGLAKIRQQPEQYGGKGLAIGGLVTSGLMLILFVAFILFVLAFAGAFS